MIIGLDIIAIIISVTAVFVNYLIVKRNSHKDIAGAAAAGEAVLKEIKFITAGVEDIKATQAKQADQYSALLTQQMESVSDIKLLTHRVEKLEGKCEG